MVYVIVWLSRGSDDSASEEDGSFQEREMKLFLKCPSTEIIPLNARPYDRAEDVKRRIPPEALRILSHTPDPFYNIDNFQLVYNYTPIQGTLADYNVAEGSTISVVMKNFNITVRSISGNSFPLKVNAFDTVEIIKSLIHEREGIPHSEQLLSFKGRRLEDENSLFHYNIQHESQIDLLPRTRGTFLLSVRITSLSKRITLEVQASDTVDLIKSMIQDEEGIPIGQQCLMLNDLEMEGNGTLSNYNLNTNSLVYLILLTSTMQIRIKDLYGRMTTLDVLPGDTIKSVKDKIYEKEGAPPHQQHLVYMGTELKNERTLSDYNIQANSVISHMLPPPPLFPDDNSLGVPFIQEVPSPNNVVVPNTVVTDTKFAWNIDNIWEEQVFQEPSYGVMLVVSPSSVREGESIATTVRVIEEPDEGDLPPNVKLASCFYEIATNGNFTKPVQFHLQHSIDLASSDWRNLSFVTRRGSRYEFSRDKQLFDPNDNSGVVHISHFSPHQFGIVYNTNDGTQPVTLYAMNLFYKRVGEDSWEVKIIITQNLQPYFEKMVAMFRDWIRRDPDTFHFSSNVDGITLNDCNKSFDINPLKFPCKVVKSEVDDCTVNAYALPMLHIEVVKKQLCEISSLKLEFEGMKERASIVIPSRELSDSGYVSVPKVIISVEALRQVPKKKILVSKLNSAKHQWRAIGEQLDVEYGKLKTIEYNQAFNDTNRLSEVLQHWIEANEDVTWKKILEVLRNPPIENKKLVDDLEKYLLDQNNRGDNTSTFPKQQIIKNETERNSETNKQDMIKDGKASYCRMCNAYNKKKVGSDETMCIGCKSQIQWRPTKEVRIQPSVVVSYPVNRPVSLPTPQEGWDCPTCTLKNLPHRPGCKACSTARPSNYVPPLDYVPSEEERKFVSTDKVDQPLSKANKWTCPRCTLDNLPYRPCCEVCAEPRPEGYVPPAGYEPAEKEKQFVDNSYQQEILRFLEHEAEEQKIEAERNYMQLQNADNMPIIENEEGFLCPVCHNYINPGDGIRLRNCLHMMCRKCLHDAVVDSESPEVKCGLDNGGTKCQEVIPEREIACVLSYEELEEFHAKGLRLVESVGPNGFHCKTDRCNGFCFYDAMVVEFPCPSCGHTNCIPCQAQHEGMSCQEHRGQNLLLPR